MTSGFITFEGIDGCGKSTIMSRAAGKLMEKGFFVESTLEPTKTWLGDAVRRSYKEKINPYSEAFLFLADRATHTDWIKNKLAQGRLVISDRYSDSTVAYQAALFHQKMGGDMNGHIDWLQRVSQPVVLKPDLTILLDIDPETSLKRLNNREEMEKFETLENLRQVRQNYLTIASRSDHVKVIDASKPIEDVLDAVFRALNQHLGIHIKQ